MKLVKKITQKRRAVSPILAAILLIGLAISAGAVLFVVVLPMITSPGGTLEIASTFKFLNTTTTDYYDKVSLPLSNKASDTATISGISIVGANNTETRAVTFTFAPFTISMGTSVIKEYSFADPVWDVTNYTVTVTFTIGDGDQDTVSAIWVPN